MAARDENTKYCVEPFNGKNFSLFKRHVEAVFPAKELDKYLDVEADETKVAEIKDAKKAYALLLTLLDDDILATMSSESSAYEIWSSLKNKYLKVREILTILNSSVSGSSNNVAFSADKRNIICHKCKSKGHIAKFCKRKLVCFGCGRPGHYKKDCKFKHKPDYKESAAVTFMVGEPVGNFIQDSGASTHMCNKGERFEEIKPFSGTVACASKNDVLKVEGIGTVSGTLNGKEILLKDVLYVPELNGQLISVKNIQKAGYSVIFKNDVAVIENRNEKFEFAKLNEKGQYVSQFEPVKASTYIANHNAELWHRRMGHSSDKILKEMGLPVSESPSSFCEECVIAKHSNTPMNKGPRSREHVPMRMVHTDICGPIDPPTREGEKYFATIIDDFSRFTEVHLLKHKGDIDEVFKLFLKQNPDLYKIRCDNAKE
ncbi:Copia protein, partial [Stegodyphus mimosarum]